MTWLERLKIKIALWKLWNELKMLLRIDDQGRSIRQKPGHNYKPRR
jgi:hypothetical protein